jgi:acyl-CoA dehydrogenase
MCDMAIVAVKQIIIQMEGACLLLKHLWKVSRNPFLKTRYEIPGYFQLFFDNVKCQENRLGDEKMGFKIMMEELARERLTVGIAVATAEGAIENTVIYTTEREAFKIQIAGFQNTQFKLAECATQVQIHQAF